MAARPRARSTRKSQTGGIVRFMWLAFAALVLATIIFSAWLWIDMRDWRPDADLYPEQGAVIPAEPEQMRYKALPAIGAQFAYLRLEQNPRALDDDFASRFALASETDLKIGVLLPFNPCIPADPQSTYFTQMVPRNDSLLPPAIEVQQLALQCPTPVSDAKVESELMTLVNQVEMHAGKPVILKVGEAFEMRHRIARSLERDLWLVRDRARPDYAGRPWLLWSANSQFHSAAAEEPLEWVVVQK
ncbi:glycoside hydrolase family 25 protein [Erythrobacter sp. YT30]|uniref:glycoside hydrolase family 25 protein n=1 Tax=Erythrobacter sp. YT30 TaxID=1735012 RepID=UPI00076C7060|nr:glycoside hydrolase family 25 protein [Erythrobacter sp. YT30]KWV91148.1 lysozyme M1 precursor [Erythrobacter sp. YT30]